MTRHLIAVENLTVNLKLYSNTFLKKLSSQFPSVLFLDPKKNKRISQSCEDHLPSPSPRPKKLQNTRPTRISRNPSPNPADLPKQTHPRQKARHSGASISARIDAHDSAGRPREIGLIIIEPMNWPAARGGYCCALRYGAAARRRGGNSSSRTALAASGDGWVLLRE